MNSPEGILIMGTLGVGVKLGVIVISGVFVFVGILVSVSDYQQFINGISSKTPADDNGVVKVLSLGNPSILVTQCNNYALLSWAKEFYRYLSFFI